jgi:hypothetical protein
MPHTLSEYGIGQKEVFNRFKKRQKYSRSFDYWTKISTLNMDLLSSIASANVKTLTCLTTADCFSRILSLRADNQKDKEKLYFTLEQVL